MTEQQALKLIEDLASAAAKKPVTVTFDTDLVGEEILDSLDSMVFAMQVEKATGRKFPEDGDLVALGYFKVRKLVTHITGTDQ